MSSIKFGRTSDKQDAQLFELTNENGIRVFITNYGGTITQLWMPDAKGRTANIVLGFDNLRQYENESPYFGAIIGRNANRIADAKFSLDGSEYKLAANNGRHNLHGGERGFDKRVWEVRSAHSGSLVLQLQSRDMEEGFPGNLTVTVGYHLNDRNELAIIYNAQSDRRTPCNLTNHTYFNLCGAGRDSILGHILRLHAVSYLAVDDELIPTEARSVVGSPMDFNLFRAIDSRIGHVAGGYDHAWLRPAGLGYDIVAEVYERFSGRFLTMYSTQPAVQFYTGNFLDGSIQGNGGTYHKHAGFCLEAQMYPNAVNRPDFPSTILEPGDVYSQTTMYKFEVL